MAFSPVLLDIYRRTVYIVYIQYTRGEGMTIWIDNQGDCPIYEQIVRQLREQILAGALPAGEALPSIRGLAKDLRVSVITTKRAYEELESEGWIFTLPGKGSFVAETRHEQQMETILAEIREHLRQARRLAAVCGIGERELLTLWEEEQK